MPSAMSSASAPVEMASIADVAVLAQAHDRALAELLLDLAESHVECLVTFHGGTLLWVARP